MNQVFVFALTWVQTSSPSGPPPTLVKTQILVLHVTLTLAFWPTPGFGSRLASGSCFKSASGVVALILM